jgi:hypothetical protein
MTKPQKIHYFILFILIALIPVVYSIDLYGSGLSSSLIFVFPFDAPAVSGVFVDTLKGLNLSIINASWSSDGRFGGALSFNNNVSGSYIPNSEDIDVSATSGLTISMWLYPNSITGTHYILGKSDGSLTSDTGWYIVHLSNALRFYYNNGSGLGSSGLATGSSIPVNAWTHYVVVIDKAAELVTVYLNGNFSASGGRDRNGTWAKNANLTVGMLSMGASASSPYNGSIDELYFWDRALSASDVSYLYANSPINDTRTITGFPVSFPKEPVVNVTKGIDTVFDVFWRNIALFLNFTDVNFTQVIYDCQCALSAGVNATCRAVCQLNISQFTNDLTCSNVTTQSYATRRDLFIQ